MSGRKLIKNLGTSWLTWKKKRKIPDENINKNIHELDAKLKH